MSSFDVLATSQEGRRDALLVALRRLGRFRPGGYRNVVVGSVGDRVAFLDLFGGEGRSVTGDRTEFIGRNGSLAAPAALARESLSNRTGSAMDPCGAVQVRVTLEPGATHTLVGLLGEAASDEGVASLVRRSRARLLTVEAQRSGTSRITRLIELK